MKAKDKFGWIRPLLYLFLLSLCLSRMGFPQGVRFGDGQPLWTTIKLTGGTALTTVANAKVNVCTAPANAVPCTNYATTYTDSSATVTCPNTTQITLAGTSTCVANGDQFGNWGVWLSAPSIPTQFVYTVTAAGISYGPFPFTIGQQTGGGAAIPGAVYATNYPSIQAAISGAGSNGAVIIPSSYAGTDAFTNSGNISIIDFRAGRQSLFNIRNWGAKVDGVTDDSAAVQATIDYGESFPAISPTGLAGAEIYIPPGTTVAGCTLPIRIHKQGISLVGVGRVTSLLGPSAAVGSCSGTVGPWIGFTGTKATYIDANPMNYAGTALLTGGTTALQITNNNYTASFLDLRDCPSCSQLSGIAQFAVEATVKPTAIGSVLMISSSSGKRDSVTSPTRAFDLYEDGAGQVLCHLNVAGSTKTVASGATVMSAGNVYHLACTYDGSTVRLFINGVSVGTPQAASGTITQSITEQVHIGCDSGDSFPDGCTGGGTSAVGTGGFYGVIDGYRISNIARYTAGFTPPAAKWGTADSNTLMECNFTTQYDSFTTCQRGAGGVINVFLPLHRTDFCPGGAQMANIEGIGFLQGGVYINPGLGVNMNHVGVFSTTGNGIMVPGICNFDSQYSDMWFTSSGASGRYSFYAGTGINHFTDFHLNGGTYQFIGPYASTLTRFFVDLDANAVIPVMIKGGTGGANYVNITDIDIDSEFAAPNLVTDLLLDNGLNANVRGSYLSNLNGPSGSFPVIVQGNLKYSFASFSNNLFDVNPASAAIVHVANNISTQQFPSFNSPIQFFYNRDRFNSGIPWTDATNALNVDRGFFTKGTIGTGVTLTNDTGTGTYPTLLVKLSGAPSKAVIPSTSDTSGVIGIAAEGDQQLDLKGTGTSSTVNVFFSGSPFCTFDGATTAGNYAQISASLAGACTDAGSSRPGSGEIIGRILTTTTKLAAPAPTVGSFTTGGSIPAGTYKVCITLINIAGGETTCGTEIPITTTGTTSRIVLNAVVNSLPGAVWPDGAAGFRVYISAAGGGSGSETLQTATTARCTGSTGTAFAEVNACGLNSGYNTLTIDTGAAVPGGNTAGAWSPVAISLSGN